MLAGEVVIGEQRDNAGAGRQRLVHLRHEIAVGKVPLLQNDPVTELFENLADHARNVSVRARSTDKKIRQLLHDRFPGFAPTYSSRNISSRLAREEVVNELAARVQSVVFKVVPPPPSRPRP